MDDIQFLVADSCQNGDQVRFASQRNDPRSQRDSHQPCANTNRRRPISTMLSVIGANEECKQEAIKREQKDENDYSS